MTSVWPEADPDEVTPGFAVPWIGKQCRVYLTNDDVADDWVVTGLLVSVNGWGEGVVDTPDGHLYVWPVLRIEELTSVIELTAADVAIVALAAALGCDDPLAAAEEAMHRAGEVGENCTDEAVQRVIDSLRGIAENERNTNSTQDRSLK
jgi:hypothetical protein